MHSLKPLCFYLFGILLLALVRLGGEGLLVDSAQVTLVIAGTLLATRRRETIQLIPSLRESP